MHYEKYLMEALELVSSWNIPDEDFAQVVNDQAKLMAGVDHDEYLESLIDIII